MSLQLTFPISKELYDEIVSLQTYLTNLDCPFAVLSRSDIDDLRDQRSYTEADEEDFKNETEEFRQKMKEWAKRDVENLDKLEAQMEPSHQYLFGKFSPDDIEREEIDIPSIFIKSFPDQETADAYFDFMIFNEAVAQAVSNNTNSENKE